MSGLGSPLAIVAVVLISVGLAFLVISVIGVLRLPDLYTRTHAVAKSETLGLILIFGGLFFVPGLTWDTAVRLAFVLGFSVLANPTAAHALVRAGRESGVRPWARKGAVKPPPEGLT